MKGMPKIIEKCERPALFPIYCGKEEPRILSIFLAVLTQTPTLLAKVMDTIGVKTLGKTQIQAYTEVEFRDKFQVKVESELFEEKDSKGIPDGLIIVSDVNNEKHRGKNENKIFSALIEAKVGTKNPLSVRQVYHYTKIAQEINRSDEMTIDAVITISNDFVSRVDHSPVWDQLKDKRKWPKNVCLYHWSWTSLLTHCRMLIDQGKTTNQSKEQFFLLQQLENFLDRSDSVKRFSSMGGQWKPLIEKTGHGRISSNFEEIGDVLNNWLSEERDLCLWLTKCTGLPVKAAAKKAKMKIADRLEHEKKYLIENNSFFSEIQISNYLPSIAIQVGLLQKSISISMTIAAPQEKKKAATRVRWLEKILESVDPNDVRSRSSCNLYVSALYKKKTGSNSPILLSLFQENSSILLDDNGVLAPDKFEIKLKIEPGNIRFISSKNFITDLEKAVEVFCIDVASKLQDKQYRLPLSAYFLDKYNDSFSD